MFEVVVEYATTMPDGTPGWAFSVTDSLFALQRPASLIGRLFAWAFDNVAEDGFPRVSRLGKMFMVDKPAVSAFFEQTAARRDVAAILCGHGMPFVPTGEAGTPTCQDAFLRVAASLRG